MNIESYNSADYNHVFTKLQDYMLSRDVILKITEDFLSSKKEEIKEKQETNEKQETTKQKEQVKKNYTEKPEFFYPREKDSLFWCFYIIKNGLFEYQIQHKNIVFEKNNKIGYIEKIRKEKQTIKPYKFASLSSIENNLVNDMRIDANTFLTLCVLENINIVFLKNNSYYELLMNDTDDIYLIKKSDNDRFGFQLINKKDAQEYKSKLFQIENIDKPIKCITYYTVSDLKDICIKLGFSFMNVENSKCKSKKELYESIVKQL